MVNEGLGCFEQVEVFDDDLLVILCALRGDGLLPVPIVASTLPSTASRLVHASFVLLNVLLRRFDLLLNFLGDVDGDLDGSVLAKVLTQVRILDVGGMLPAAVILE